MSRWRAEGTDIVDSYKHLDEVRKESEQFMVRYNVALVGCNRADKLTRLLVAELVNVANTVFQQLSYDAVSWLRQGLKRAHSTVRVLCQVVLTSVSGDVSTTFR